jgi:hypothetical protein
MQRWEYLNILVHNETWFDSLGRTGHLRTLDVPDTPYEQYGITAELLNKLGELGWELTGTASSSSASIYHLFLKRPLP